MNKFFKASLLANVFVGMSSFSTITDIDRSTGLVKVEGDVNCEDLASTLYNLVSVFAPHTSQAELTGIWFDAYWTCLDSGLRYSEFEANP